MEIGLFSFAETLPHPITGQVISQGARIRNLLREIVFAEQVGLEVIGVGEHHRKDFAVSAPAIVLAAAAAQTERIRLTSAVTVLGSEDPVRLFQNFATIDLISNGRAEIIAGRGSFIESFPLFGQELDHYDEIFAEKLDLLLQLREHPTITWQGHHRPSINAREIYPQPQQQPLPIWLGIGGTPQSAIRAAALQLPLALAIIGGQYAQFGPLVDLYRRAWIEYDNEPTTQRLGLNVHGYIAETSQQARDEAYPSYEVAMNMIGRERGWAPIDRAHFERECDPGGALLVGSPTDVTAKILHQHELLGHDRLLVQMSVGGLPHDRLMRSIELLGTEVAPRVRAIVAERMAASAG